MNTNGHEQEETERTELAATGWIWAHCRYSLYAPLDDLLGYRVR